MKKEKLTINSLAIKTIKSRKKQYISMVVGIVLAMVFSSSIIFFSSCLEVSIEEIIDRKVGEQDIIVSDAQLFAFDAQDIDDLVEEIGYAHLMGYGYSEKTNNDKGFLIARFDEKAKELSNPSLLEGEFPNKAGEIAIEEDTLLNMNVNKTVGDNIELNIKTFDDNEFKKIYKISGILYNQRRYIEKGIDFDYPSIMVSPNEKINNGGNVKTLAFCKYINSKRANDYFSIELDEQLRRLHKTNNELDTEINNYIGERVSILGYNNFKFDDLSSQTFIVSVVALSLLLASCIGIVNALSSNFKIRKAQIGMYRAVGATRYQIIKIFGREILFISVLSVPLSLIISFLLTKAIIYFMGKEFIFIPQLNVLFKSGLVSLLCVLITSFIPLIHASRISPMHGVRDVEMNRKFKRKKIKSRKTYEPSKLIAKRSLTFFRFKQVCVSVFIALTIVLSGLGLSYIEMYNTKIQENIPEHDYELIGSGEGSGSYAYNVNTLKNGENVKYDILSYPGVDKVEGIKSCHTNIILGDKIPDYLLLFYKPYTYSDNAASSGSIKQVYKDFNSLNKFAYSNFSKDYINFKDALYKGSYFYETTINSADETEIEKLDEYVVDGQINIEKLNSGEEIILYAYPKAAAEIRTDEEYNNVSVNPIKVDSTTERKDNTILSLESNLNYKAGDTVTLSTVTVNKNDIKNDEENNSFYIIPKNYKEIKKTVKIGAVVSANVKRHYQQAPNFITTNKGFENYMPKYPYLQMYIDMNGDVSDEIDKSIVSYLEHYDLGNTKVKSLYSQNKDNKLIINSLYAAIAVMVILFISISASIVNSSIATQIRNSKREFGTLRAVGASSRELTQIYIRELLSMFGWGIGIGTITYALIWIVIITLDKINEWNLNIGFTIWPALIIAVLLFVICAVNVFIKVKKQMKNSIVENIREL